MVLPIEQSVNIQIILSKFRTCAVPTHNMLLGWKQASNKSQHKIFDIVIYTQKALWAIPLILLNMWNIDSW